ncbi:MAG: hypothetical protein SVM80_00165 [Halobacteriota archaeon]|nr:hypothetical protein [Halobacteriota archaeon]
MANELKDALKKAIDEKKGIDLSVVSSAIEKMSEDDDIKTEMSLTPDMVFNISSDPVIGMKVELKGGKPSVSSGLSDEADFFMELSYGTLSAIISGERDVTTSLMGGDIAMWRDGRVGNMSKAMDLMPLITAVAEKMELKV